jgi:choline dehydrogenase
MLDARSVPDTHDWGFEGDVSLLRARIVGGCSAHNACFVVWGAREDYDEWAGLAGDPSWSFAGLEPYLRRAEEQLATRVPEPEELSAWHRAALEAALEAGVPGLSHFNDLDAGTGIAAIPLNARGRVRWSTALAYLDEARPRPNLEVLDRTLVDRVELRDGRAGGAIARRDGAEARIEAGLVVLAAGAYGSPAILLRSGIGPEDHLGELGIGVARPLAGVGRNLVDHPGASIFFQPTDRLAAELRAQDERGLLFEGQCAVRARSADCPDALWDLHLLPWASRCDESTPATGSASIEGDYEAHVTVFAMKPASRGRVRLSAVDPMALPSVDQAFLSDPEGLDVAALADGIDLARRVAAEEPIASLVEGEAIPGPRVADRPALERWVREAVRGYFHPVGTCRMGREEDPEAVVDGGGRVHGFDNLYVCDASIMPTIPRANTNLTTVAIAERIAERVKESAPG